MTGSRLFFLLFFSFISLFVINLVLDIGNDEVKKSSLGVTFNSEKVHIASFYDEQLFYKGLSEVEENYRELNYQFAGGIIPHDFLPGYILSDFYKKLSDQDVETIILIGPNHYEEGTHKFLTSTYDWSTTYGLLESDKNKSKELIAEDALEVGEEVLPKDHAVGSSMPYIKYYLPEVKIVPILISGFATQDEVYDFAKSISVNVDESTVVVAAVDFSHYLNSAQAKEKDKITLDLINSRDYKRIFSLNNNFTDSPPSIGAILMIMEILGKTNMKVLHNTNSGIIQNDEYIDTTSYFSIVFH